MYLLFTHARWLVKRKRPLSLPEDPEYREIWARAMNNAYIPPDKTTTRAHVLQLSAEGQARLFDINKHLRDDFRKPGAAGDIWSSGGVSLLGICHYSITDTWEIDEFILAAAPFSDESHTSSLAQWKRAGPITCYAEN